MKEKKSVKKLTWFARPPKFRIRMALMLVGVILQGMGLSVLRLINMGTDPCSCLTQGVTNYVPLSFGTAQLLCHLVTFAFVIRFDMSRIGFGTIGNMVCLGYISDFFTWVWGRTLPSGLNFFAVQRICYILLLPALVVFILGAATYMTAGLGASPYDALPFIISEHTNKLPFRAIRVIWDICFMIGGLLLGGDVGIVTVAVAFFLGPVINLLQKRLEVLLR